MFTTSAYFSQPFNKSGEITGIAIAIIFVSLPYGHIFTGIRGSTGGDKREGFLAGSRWSCPCVDNPILTSDKKENSNEKVFGYMPCGQPGSGHWYDRYGRHSPGIGHQADGP
jgi:hypothetical protein